MKKIFFAVIACLFFASLSFGQMLPGGYIPGATSGSGSGVTDGTAAGQSTFWDGDSWEPSQNLTWNSASNRLEAKVEGTATNSVEELLRFYWNTSGTATDGGGMSIPFYLESAVGVDTLAASMDVSWLDESAGTTVVNFRGAGRYIFDDDIMIKHDSGTNRDVSIIASSTLDNIARTSIYPYSGTNVMGALSIIPKGTGYNSTTKSEISVYNTDQVADGVNTEWAGIRAIGPNGYIIGSGKTGLGTNRDIDFAAGWFSNGSKNYGQLHLVSLSGYVGVNTTGPDRRLEVLDATNPQLRLTHTDSSIYSDFQTDSNGDLTITPSGDEVIIPNATWLSGEDFAGTGTVNALKINTDDQIEVGADFLLKDSSGATIYEVDSDGMHINVSESYSISDSGDGNPATDTFSPAASYVELTCSDSDTCDITMGETGMTEGMIVEMINISANVCDFSDSSGVSELAGAFAMGQYDSLTIRYIGDRWVEISRSDN